MKRLLSIAFVMIMVLSLIGCGNNAESNTGNITAENNTGNDNSEDKQTEENTEKDSEETTGKLNTEEAITLKIYGPGFFGESGEKGAMSAYTGEMTMGYDKVLERWNELYPNVTVELQAIGWDDWRAAIQAAVLGEGVDVIAHGGLLPVLCEPLDGFLAEDPELLEQLYSVPKYNTDEMDGSVLNVPSITSIPATLNVATLILNKKIFEDYGVDLPDASWTWSDVVEVASKLTGTDPVTGEQTYGFLMPGTNGTNMIKSYQIIASAYDAKVISYGETAKDSVVDFTTEGTAEVFKTLADLAEFCSPDNREGVVTSRVYTEDCYAITWSEGIVGAYLQVKDAGLEDQYTFLPLPAIEKGENAGNPSLYLGDNNLAISKTSEHKEWAWEFIKFMMTDEIAIQYAQSNGWVWNTAAGVDALESVIGTDNTQMVKDILSKLPSDYNSTTNAYYDGVNFGTMSAYLSDWIREMVKGSLSVEETQEKVQASVDEYMGGLK